MILEVSLLDNRRRKGGVGRDERDGDLCASADEPEKREEDGVSSEQKKKKRQ